MIFKPGPEIDPRQVPGHRSCGLARVTQATNFFILQICKNDIILVKILQKKNQWVLRRILKNNKEFSEEIGSSFFCSWFLDLLWELTPSSSKFIGRVS
jgi:hypothetical protein